MGRDNWIATRNREGTSRTPGEISIAWSHGPACSTVGGGGSHVPLLILSGGLRGPQLGDRGRFALENRRERPIPVGQSWTSTRAFVRFWRVLRILRNPPKSLNYLQFNKLQAIDREFDSRRLHHFPSPCRCVPCVHSHARGLPNEGLRCHPPVGGAANPPMKSLEGPEWRRRERNPMTRFRPAARRHRAIMAVAGDHQCQ